MTQDAQPDDPRLFQGTLWLSLHVLALGLASSASRLPKVEGSVRVYVLRDPGEGFGFTPWVRGAGLSVRIE